jgi:hypothetical protein
VTRRRHLLVRTDSLPSRTCTHHETVELDGAHASVVRNGEQAGQLEPQHEFVNPVWPTLILRYGPPDKALSMFTGGIGDQGWE